MKFMIAFHVCVALFVGCSRTHQDATPQTSAKVKEDARYKWLEEQEAKALALIAKVPYEPSSFEWDGKSPMPSIRVTNNLDEAIASVQFIATCKSPGRAVRWDRDDQFCLVPGGIEPGETKELLPWGESDFPLPRSPKDRDDLVVTVEIATIIGPGEKFLVSRANVEDWDTLTIERERRAKEGVK